MSANPSVLDTGGAAGVASKATASVTPGAGRLQLLVVASVVAAGNTPTATGCNLTWVQVGTVTVGGTRLTVLRAQGSAPSTGAVTIDFAAQSQTQLRYILLEIPDVVNDEGANGARAVVQSASNSAAGPGTTLAVTLAGFAKQDNLCLGCFYNGNSTSLTTPGAGFVLVSEGSQTSVDLAIEAQPSQSLSVSASWTSVANNLGIALEIATVPTLPAPGAQGPARTLGLTLASTDSLYRMAPDLGLKVAPSLFPMAPSPYPPAKD